jgi:hypothetical protein
MFTDTSSKNHDVYKQGFVINGFVKRFSVDRSADNSYELVINKTDVSDSGIYRCIRFEDGGSTQRIFEYHVSVIASTLKILLAYELVPHVVSLMSLCLYVKAT